MVLDKDLGIGINIADWENKIKISSIKRDLILEKSNLNDKKEEMRVLYVALTRAERKISIIGKKMCIRDRANKSQRLRKQRKI